MSETVTIDPAGTADAGPDLTRTPGAGTPTPHTSGIHEGEAGSPSSAERSAVGVHLRHLTKRYGTTAALDDFSMDIAPGEMVVLLGPSGCGKTTALRALAGLAGVDGGSIGLGGRDVTDVPAAKRDLAMVFQQYSLFPHLSALENVAFGLRVRRMHARERAARAATYLELVGLEDQADKYPHQMSGGQQQRVALARALAVHPSVLLLDEPLSALDAKVRLQLRDEIRNIQRQTGTTTLFVTHDQEEALAVADRIGVMRAGRLQQIDTPERIYSEPANEFVATFIGHSNRLPGVSDGTTAVVRGRTVPLIPNSAAGPVEVLIRPEAVALVPPARADSRDRSLLDRTDRVISSVFLGNQARVTVGTDEGGRVVAQISPKVASSLRPGDPVGLDFLPIPALAVACTQSRTSADAS